MSNGRSIKRKLSGRSGSSPRKSKRRAFKVQRSRWEMQRAMNKLSEAAKPVADMAAEALAPKENDDDD